MSSKKKKEKKKKLFLHQSPPCFFLLFFLFSSPFFPFLFSFFSFSSFFADWRKTETEKILSIYTLWNCPRGWNIFFFLAVLFVCLFDFVCFETNMAKMSFGREIVLKIYYALWLYDLSKQYWDLFVFLVWFLCIKVSQWLNHISFSKGIPIPVFHEKKKSKTINYKHYITDCQTQSASLKEIGEIKWLSQDYSQSNQRNTRYLDPLILKVSLKQSSLLLIVYLNNNRKSNFISFYFSFLLN